MVLNMGHAGQDLYAAFFTQIVSVHPFNKFLLNFISGLYFKHYQTSLILACARSIYFLFCMKLKSDTVSFPIIVQ